MPLTFTLSQESKGVQTWITKVTMTDTLWYTYIANITAKVTKERHQSLSHHAHEKQQKIIRYIGLLFPCSFISSLPPLCLLSHALVFPP